MFLLIRFLSVLKKQRNYVTININLDKKGIKLNNSGAFKF